jgi:ubiquinone/menaquinone biosynthesis C-methylase UbiE
MTMRRSIPFAVLHVFLIAAAAAAQPDAKQSAQERKQAESDAPKLSAVLELQPGSTIADVGAGFGAMTVALAARDKTGRVIATEIAATQLEVIRDAVAREGLDNVTVIESGASSANLPDGCCDAIFLRLVYHHISDVAPFNRSLFTALKPGGRLAIIEFPPDKGSALPANVPANREGHGIRAPIVVEELTAAGFEIVRTIDKWPPEDKTPGFLVLARKPATGSSSR